MSSEHNHQIKMGRIFQITKEVYCHTSEILNWIYNTKNGHRNMDKISYAISIHNILMTTQECHT